MKIKLVLTLAALCICMVGASGNAFAQKLYPVQGPLAAQTPQPIFTGQVRRPMFSVGSVFLLLKSWKVANGEVLEGKPKTVKASSVTAAPPAGQISLPQPNLAFAWDAVYGEGFFVAHILGNEFGQGVFTGNQGTVLQVETLDGRNGVAVDNKGNTYKMVW
ncbi:MAG: hypothetical protein WA254_06155 [Candidatus Sulfotelmatobacter sp.]